MEQEISLSEKNDLKTENSEQLERPVPDRNALALDRTVLANERTYQAWLRTGMAAFGAGLGIAKFMKGSMPLWILVTTANIFILLSAAAFLQASWRYCHINLHTAHLDVDSMPVWKVKVFSSVLAGCSILTLIGLMVTAKS